MAQEKTVTTKIIGGIAGRPHITPELANLLRDSVERMSSEEREAMYRAQRKSWMEQDND